MKKIVLSSLMALAVILLQTSASASPIGVDGKYGAEWAGITPVVIPGDATAANGNFGSPGNTANVGYNIYVRDDGSFFYVLATTTDPNALPFENLYIDTIASTPNTGSNFGVEVTNHRAFIPGGSGYTELNGTGFIFATATTAGVYGIEASIPNSFFLTDPLGMGFAKTPNGTLVSVHLSQTFSYSVVGGNALYPAPVELGDAIVGSTAPVPEPATLEYMALSGLGALSFAGRRLINRLRA